MNFGTPVQNFGSTTSFGASQTFGGTTNSFGSSQNFSGQPQSFTSSRPQNFTPPSMPAGYQYSDNCWRVHDDGRPMSFGSRWGDVPNSTPRPSPGYRSPNDGLMFSSAPDISIDANGNPLHAFSGSAVDRDFAIFMRAAYPDRSWPDICKNGPLPAPGYRSTAAAIAAANKVHQQVNQERYDAREAAYQQSLRPQSSSPLSPQPPQPPQPQPQPRPQSPQPTPPKVFRRTDDDKHRTLLVPPNPYRHNPKTATQIFEELERQWDPVAYERATIGSAANRESFERIINEFLYEKNATAFAHHVCGEEQVTLAQKCASDLGFNTKGFIVETMIKSVLLAVAKRGSVKELATKLATEAAINGSAATATSDHCLEIFNNFLYGTCLRSVREELDRRRRPKR